MITGDFGNKIEPPFGMVSIYTVEGSQDKEELRPGETAVVKRFFEPKVDAESYSAVVRMIADNGDDWHEFEMAFDSP